jgi:dTDP-4-amino-4,6-dideoxygalactose transaminase
MAQLALRGGPPVRTTAYPSWPRAGAEERKWLDVVLSGSRWFAGLQGDDPEAVGSEFGRRFAALHGATYGLPVANGSVAIELALRAVGVQPGDEVIVPCYTFVSTATSALMIGAIPVFADIEAESYCLDPADVERRITARTRAIVPVHLGGHMTDMPRLMEVARKRGIAVVEDCAQSIDSSLGGRKAGTWGVAGTFSFQSNKTVTSGEGGLILTNDDDLARQVTALRAFGRFNRGGAARSSSLEVRQVSSNYRLSEFQAAVLLGQLERFPAEDERRRANADYLTRALARVPGVRHVRKAAPDMKHGYYYYLIRYEPALFGGATPERLCAALNAEGIPFVPGDRKPVYRHPVFEPDAVRNHLWPDALERYRDHMVRTPPQCPVAEEACTSTLVLRHQVLLAERRDMDDVVEALLKVAHNAGELEPEAA